MKRIKLHLIFAAIVLPCVILLCINSLTCNFFGVIYLAYVLIIGTDSKWFRKFLRAYYHEILRLERGL